MQTYNMMSCIDKHILVIRYVLRSPLRPPARPCICDASISCSQNPISPEDVIERTQWNLDHTEIAKQQSPG